MFQQLLKLKIGPISPPVRVKAIKDLHWTIQECGKDSLHIKADTQGYIVERTAIGFIVEFDNDKRRQIADMPNTSKKATDEITII